MMLMQAYSEYYDSQNTEYIAGIFYLSCCEFRVVLKKERRCNSKKIFRCRESSDTNMLSKSGLSSVEQEIT